MKNKNKEDEQKRFIKKWFVKLNKLAFENKNIKNNSRIAKMWLGLVLYIVNTQEIANEAAHHYFVSVFLTIMAESLESITQSDQYIVFDLINKLDILIRFNRDKLLGEGGSAAGIEMSNIFQQALKKSI